jgi:hypothetical protein
MSRRRVSARTWHQDCWCYTTSEVWNVDFSVASREATLLYVPNFGRVRRRGDDANCQDRSGIPQIEKGLR